jgi:hypothetical protein
MRESGQISKPVRKENFMHIGIRAPAHAYSKSCKNKNEFSRSEIIILTLFVERNGEINFAFTDQ